MRIVTFSVLFLLPFAFSGCIIIPYPHTTRSSPEIRGRVVNAATHEPVGGAEISIHERPRTRVVSDATGQFILPVHHNFHLCITGGPCADDLPQGLPYCDTIDISRAGYARAEINAKDHLDHPHERYKEPMILRDVLLVPANK